MTIVDRIREKCAQVGYTIASLERDAHIANGTISKWNESKLSAENLSKVADKLNTSMDYLYNGIESENNIISSDEQEWLGLYRELNCCDPRLLKECTKYIKGSILGYHIGNEQKATKDIKKK